MLVEKRHYVPSREAPARPDVTLASDSRLYRKLGYVFC